MAFCILALQSAAAAEPPRVLAARSAVLQGAERDRFIAAHNAARKPLGLDPLSWSEALAGHALETLQQQQEALIRDTQEGWSKKHLPIPAHRSDSPYGENIAAWTGPKQTADWAVRLWLREKRAFDSLNAKPDYRFGDEQQPASSPTPDAKPSPAPSTENPPRIIVGHYTQIVWRTTTHLGAAQLTFDLVDDQGSTRTYAAIVCNYDPPGNRRGEKVY